jgi:hypothetical protein
MAAMLGRYKKWWMRNFSQSVGNDRTGLRAWIFLLICFVANVGIIISWFVAMLAITKLAVMLNFVPEQNSAQIAIAVMNIMAFGHLIFFCLTKRGENLLRDISEKIESALFPVRFKVRPALIKTQFHQLFKSFIPPVPTAPPRTSRT